MPAHPSPSPGRFAHSQATRGPAACFALSFALLTSLAGCEPRATDTRGQVVPDRSTASAPIVPARQDIRKKVIPPSQLQVQVVAAGYGGVGPQVPSPSPDTWTVLILDVQAQAAVEGLVVREIVFSDKEGKMVARATAPWSLRRDTRPRSESDRQRGDFSEQGTVPFDGKLESGTSLRLRLHAPLDTRSESRKGEPVSARALVAATGDTGVWVDCPPLSPWPSG